MTLERLLGWWNLIFLAPLAVALLYLFVYTLTGLTFGEPDVDADADVEADADSDADTDADHDAAGHGGGHGSFAALALSWAGVGRVPLSLVLLVFLLVWGAAGLLTNSTLGGRTSDGWAAARVSIPVALVVAVVVTRAVVMLLARFAPMNDTSARPLRSLVGTVGEALYPIDASFGMAVVRDANGDLKTLPCRVGDGVQPVDKGARVRLVAFDAAERFFYVAPTDPAPPEREVKAGAAL